MIKASDKMGLFFFPVAIFVIVITTNFLTQAWKKKKRYIRQINEVSEKLSNQSVPTVWDLEADYFGYKDYQCETKTSWSAFSHFYVKANALHMVLHYRTESSFSISEGEVGNEMFNEIVEFVTAKIGVGVKT